MHHCHHLFCTVQDDVKIQFPQKKHRQLFLRWVGFWADCTIMRYREIRAVEDSVGKALILNTRNAFVPLEMTVVGEVSSRQRSSLGQSVHRHPQPHGKACKHYGGEAVLPVDERSALRNRYGRFVPFSLRPCACFHLCCIFCGTDRIKRSAVRVVGKPRCRHFGCHVNKAARQAERLCPPTNTATFRHRKIPLRRRPSNEPL